MRGVEALELSFRGAIRRISPTQSISQNRALRHYIRLHANELGVAVEAYKQEATLRLGSADQYLIRIRDGVAIDTVPMNRGNEYVPVEAVDRKRVERAAKLLETWMWTNLDPTGAITYMWFPSSGRTFERTNMIREFMATVALGHAARRAGDAHLERRQTANIEHNFRRYFKTDGRYGYILYREQSKLGAIALAHIALLERSDAEVYADVRERLLATTFRLQRQDGSFYTFFPEEAARQGDNENFYPGECLLAWAKLYQRRPSAELLERYRRSTRYYREWHRANRNPAFIPWHTQAHYIMWQETQDRALADFVLEMNDWLVTTMAQWDGVAYPDLRGRFYAPGGRFGPPHASSTGSYLEGLVDAFALARAMGDRQRVARYRSAIVRGLRSVLQLVFEDDIDLFYVSGENRRRTRGGVREAVYNNRIRVDNVQHNLMAMYKVLDVFTEEDFRAVLQ